VVENVTGTEMSGLPLMSSTLAVITLEPPSDDTVAGFALTLTRPTAAEPTAILTAPFAPTLAPPDIAEIVAVPDWPPARNVTVTRPLASVRASDGSIVPSDVVNEMSVPLCGGVPDASITWAMMLAEPLVGRAVADAVKVMVEPAGARSGTFWEATASPPKRTSAARTTGSRKRAIIRRFSILSAMKRSGQAGYAMAALLVAMSIMAVMMTVAMPVWKQSARREKEAELIWRGQQYQRAIGLFGRKFANAFPPSIDVLVDQKFLRKKYKDPITGDDFQPLTQGQPTTPGSGSATGSRPGTMTSIGANPATAGANPATAGTNRGATSNIGTTASGGFGTPVTGAAGGIVGVVSKSKAKSIRLYNGRDHYNEWAFIFTQQNVPGGPGGVPGQVGRPGQGGVPRPGQGGFGVQPRNPNTPRNPNDPRNPIRRPGLDPGK